MNVKYHISVKFLAIILAALTLFCALASGAGIIVLTAGDLYENSVDDLYESNMAAIRRNFAVNLVHRYASLNLGNLPEDYLNQYFGTHWQYDTFQYGSYYYTIRNEKGQIVESTLDKAIPNAVRYKIQVTEVNYRNAVSLESAIHDDDWQPDIGSAPTETYAWTAEPMESIAIEETTAPQEWAPGDVVPESTDPGDIPATSEPVTPVTTPEDDFADAAPEDAVLEDMGTASASATLQETAKFAATGTYQEYDFYYDHETDRQMRLCFTIQELPPYTVELYLLPGAAPEEHMYTLLRAVWTVRYELFWILGISVLLFAIFAVYLCCAAGRRPGREEIKANGFNCIPLDLYLATVGFLIAAALVFGAEGSNYLLRTSPKVLIPLWALAGYCCCLLLVAFGFACAAQFKTPDFYWWRNSILGRCLKLTGKLCVLSFRGVAWVCRRTPKILRTLWRWLIQLWNFGWGLCKKIWNFVWGITAKSCRWTGRKLHRAYSLLPVTWQWLLVGGIMFLLMSIIIASNGEESLIVLCTILLFGIILYGAHAFGILLEATKRMGKGDLDTKVSDQFLMGSFKEFAGDLNALANVAVVAAQKQMRSDRMKTELITNVSHDIKTPLTSIINYVDLLQMAESEEDRAACLEVLSRQSLQLKKLIEDLMEMSKASSGNITADIIPVNASEAINQALGEFADKLDRAQLTPLFRQPEEPVYMLADGRLAWRVLSNLLSNVVKYAMPGTRVYIDLMELDGKVILSMKNISREPLNVSADELLERFVRGDASRNTEGSGLGLNIAQSLMEIQKGQLQLLVDGDLFKVTLVFPGTTL